MGQRLVNVRNWEKLIDQADFHPVKMAQLCRVSLRQLERHFKQSFRTTPIKWANEIRCRRAIKLVASGYSTKAIAAELKFGSPSHFCHVFKRTKGLAPQMSDCPITEDSNK